MSTLRAAVIGTGYLGRFHAQKYAALEDIKLVAVADVNPVRAREAAAPYGISAYTDFRDILEQVDLVSIAVPTEHHFGVARACLDAGLHVLLEKPITQTVTEAEELIRIAQARGRVLQIGHLERFNPAVVAMGDIVRNPIFIESHRLAKFKPRGTDVNVILDLMIHDIDIILSLVQSPVRSLRAVGLPVLSSEIDIANARLEFDNGCVANVTASRVSQQSMRKIRVFQPQAYISVDYQGRRLHVHRRVSEALEPGGIPGIRTEEQDFPVADPLMAEIRAFVDAVRNGIPPKVSGADGKRALEVALAISRDIEAGPAAVGLRREDRP